MIGIRKPDLIVKQRLITYSMEVFDTFLNTVEVPQVKYIHGYITDEQGKVLYYDNVRHESVQDFLQVEEGEATLIAKPLEYFGWTANVIMDETQMKAHVEEIYHRGLALYMLILMVYVMIIIMIIRRLLNPIHSISESLKAAERGDYNSKIRIEGRNEIWQLAEEYNRMADAIEEKNCEIRRKNEERLLSLRQQHRAEMEALESQINAHFICNTLGCINYEAIEAGNHQVSVLIKKLSNILRYTFDQRSQMVYMFQEIAWVDQYLYLQKNRYDHRILRLPNTGHTPCQGISHMKNFPLGIRVGMRIKMGHIARQIIIRNTLKKLRCHFLHIGQILVIPHRGL